MSETVELAPTWLRELNALFGTVAVVLGFLVIAFPYINFVLPEGSLGLAMMQLRYLGGALALVGILTLLPDLGLFEANVPMSMFWRFLDLIFATAMTVLALVSMIAVVSILPIVVDLLAAFVFLHAISDVLRGFFVKRLPLYYRGLHIFFATLYVMFFLLLVTPAWLVSAWIPVYLAAATVLLGIQHLYHGLTGGL